MSLSVYTTYGVAEVQVPSVETVVAWAVIESLNVSPVPLAIALAQYSTVVTVVIPKLQAQ
jgi:hypothetical protein